eukprot:1300346-Rhodomonas_salina.1
MRSEHDDKDDDGMRRRRRRCRHADMDASGESNLEVDDADGVEKKSSVGGALGEGRGQRRLEHRQHVRKVPETMGDKKTRME